MRALVIGGTGSSGVHVVRGLAERGHDVRLLHRGVHEPPGLPDIRHIHADPHFAENLAEATAMTETSPETPGAEAQRCPRDYPALLSQFDLCSLVVAVRAAPRAARRRSGECYPSASASSR